MFKQIASKVTVERLRDITPYQFFRQFAIWISVEMEIDQDSRQCILREGER